MNSSDLRPTVFLVDAYAMIYRSYFAFIKNPRVNSKGVNTSAVFGFVSSFIDLVLKRRPTHAAVAFDLHGPTFRHALYADYKANRQAQPEDIGAAVPYVHRFVRALGVAEASAEGYEADDVVGTLARRYAAEGAEVVMVTPDKDYAQLLAPRVTMLRPHTGGAPEAIGEADVAEKFGVASPAQMVDLLGLWGDASDNIPGCPGVGEVTAKKLLAAYGSIDGIYENIASVKGKMRERLEQNRELVMLSRRLAAIATDAPIDVALGDLAVASPDWGALDALFAELEIRGMTERIRAAMGLADPAEPSLFSFGAGEAAATPPAAPDYATAESTPHAYYLVKTAEELDADRKSVV